VLRGVGCSCEKSGILRVSDLYDALSKKTAVLVNKFSTEMKLQSNEDQNILTSKLEEMFKHPVIGMIPCYCDVLQAERTSLLAVEKPSHLFIRKLEEVADKLEKSQYLT